MFRDFELRKIARENLCRREAFIQQKAINRQHFSIQFFKLPAKIFKITRSDGCRSSGNKSRFRHFELQMICDRKSLREAIIRQDFSIQFSKLPAEIFKITRSDVGKSRWLYLTLRQIVSSFRVAKDLREKIFATSRSKY